MPLQGKGFFIWKIRECENGDAGAIANQAEMGNFSHVLIKIADGVYSYNYDWDNLVDLVPPVADALRAKGIQVWGWHYVYGEDPIGEARKAVQRVQELGLDGYVFDAESEYKEPGKDVAAVRFLQELRAGIPNTPVALSSYRYPSYHPQIPWEEFLSEVDYNMPQVYWLLAHNPGAQLSRSVREFSSMQFTPPIIPVGAAYYEYGWKPNASEVMEFLQTAVALNLSAANFWEWSSCRENLDPLVWTTIQQFPWDGGITPLQDITEKYIAALNSRDPDEVMVYYNSNAVHVTSARTIQGTAAIRAWYTTLFNQILPEATFTLTGFSGSGNSRHFTWTAQSNHGQVNNGNDTLGLIDGNIAYHYSFFTVT